MHRPRRRPSRPRRGALVSLLPLLLAGFPASSRADDEFAKLVRTTPPLLPEDQLESFRLPTGFEIQLVASEPAIQKPMNLAFDARGRLWVTTSREYPYAAPLDGPARDTIRVLEDFDGDGRAETMSVFADGLNVPIGLYPYRNGVIAFSIPNIWFFVDHDGDDRADERRVLYTGFGYERDTHGLNNGFRRGFDGWLYACHGFNNASRARGADGHVVAMQSGNTYRMLLDGSHLEQFTHGQVNPFGRTFDALGNHFAADCHSKPIYQLVRHGFYPSFGKPHDGLGFVPPMMEHLHGSTAIAGVAIYTGEGFPAEYRGNIFTGNVMTSRVNRDSLSRHGATFRAHAEADFVVSGDPWFRPVDIRCGPDGALYVADFYNRIIGHYEVPLEHPGRDRHRGRIWRVVYRGDAAQGSAERAPDLTGMRVEEVIETLDHANLARRLLATDRLVDEVGEAAVGPALAALRAETGTRWRRAHLLWVLERLGALPAETLVAATAAAEPEVRVHALQIVAERGEWSGALRDAARSGLEDSDALARLAAVDALGEHPLPEQVPSLLALLARTDAEDEVLRYKSRMALRDHLRDAGTLEALALEALDTASAADVASVALALETPAAGAFLLRYLERYEASPRDLAAYLRHAGRFLPPSGVDSLVRVTRSRVAGDLDLQLELIEAVLVGVAQRDARPTESLEAWGSELASALVASAGRSREGWSHHPSGSGAGGSGAGAGDAPENPWALERRPCADGERALLLSSLPHGERRTGTLRSHTFEIPGRLRFFLAGHIGFPDRPVVARNFVRLRAAGDGRVLRQVSPPRNDTAREVVWELDEYAGQRGYLELVDGDDGTAYAWLAAGRFDPPLVRVPETDPSRVSARLVGAMRLIASLRIESLADAAAALLREEASDAALRQAAANALLALEPDARKAALVPLLGAGGLSGVARREVSEAFLGDDEGVPPALDLALGLVPARLQAAVAERLTETAVGAELCLDLMQRGRLAPQLLHRRSLRGKLAALERSALDAAVGALLEAHPESDDRIPREIAERRASFDPSAASVTAGAEVFARDCAVCHQIGGQGKLVGPQLDGVGGRGLERLLEDILDPHRNVDVAFRSTVYVLADGRVVTGLFRREEGDTVVVADSKGEEFRLEKSQVLRATQASQSPMPENFNEALTRKEFDDLLAFLLATRG